MVNSDKRIGQLSNALVFIPQASWWRTVQVTNRVGGETNRTGVNSSLLILALASPDIGHVPPRLPTV